MEIKIQVMVSMRIPAENLQALLQLIPVINGRVFIGEPETLLYRWYFNKDNTDCTLHEGFPSENAFLDHVKNVEPVLNELFTLAPISGWQIYGNISPELMEGLKAFGASQNITPQFSHYLSGFVRQGEKSFSNKELLSAEEKTKHADF